MIIHIRFLFHDKGGIYLSKNKKYEQIAESLRAKIRSGRLLPDSQIDTEDILMKKYGVGKNTIRHAVSLLEEEGLLKRRQGSGTYVTLPKKMKQGTMTIGVMVVSLSEYIFPVMIRGIEAETDRQGYRFLLRSTGNRVDEERRLLQYFIDNPVDGLIVEASKAAFPNPNLELYRQLFSLKIPVVFLCSHYAALEGTVFISTDDFSGGYLAAESLIRRGHRRIAGLFKADDITGQQRYAGFMVAMRTNGLEINDGSIFWYTTGQRKNMFHGTWGDAIFAAIEEASAVICFNDQAAVPLMNLLIQKGKHIPEDMAVISFDNSSFGQLAPIPLSSLDYDKEGIGALAVRKLVHMIEGKEEHSQEIPWTLVERDSSLADRS